MYQIKFKAKKQLTCKKVSGHWYSFHTPTNFLEAWKDAEKLVGEKLTQFTYVALYFDMKCFDPVFKEE